MHCKDKSRIILLLHRSFVVFPFSADPQRVFPPFLYIFLDIVREAIEKLSTIARISMAICVARESMPDADERRGNIEID